MSTSAPTAPEGGPAVPSHRREHLVDVELASPVAAAPQGQSAAAEGGAAGAAAPAEGTAVPTAVAVELSSPRNAYGINHKLSWPSIAFLALIGALFLYWGFVVSFATAAVLPFLLLPLALLLAWWARNRHVTPLDAVVSAFARGFTPYAALTFLFELLVGLITTAFTGHFLQLPKADTALALFIFAVWGSLATLEEYIKYRLAVLAERAPAARSPPGKEKLIVSTAQTTGFACGLMILLCFLYSIVREAAAAGATPAERARERASHTGAVFAVAAVLAVINLPVTCLTGYLISLRVVLRDQFAARAHESLPRLLALPALLRSALLLHILLAMSGAYGARATPLWWVALVAPAVAVAAGLLVVVRRTEQELPRAYLQRVGSLTFAYAQLTGDEEDAPVTPVSPSFTARARLERLRAQRRAHDSQAQAQAQGLTQRQQGPQGALGGGKDGQPTPRGAPNQGSSLQSVI